MNERRFALDQSRQIEYKIRGREDKGESLLPRIGGGRFREYWRHNSYKQAQLELKISCFYGVSSILWGPSSSTDAIWVTWKGCGALFDETLRILEWDASLEAEPGVVGEGVREGGAQYRRSSLDQSFIHHSSSWMNGCRGGGIKDKVHW